MNRPRWIQLLALVVAAGAVLAASLLQRPIQESRREFNLVADVEGVGEDEAELKVYQAMPGGLRALAIDLLWIRSQRQKSAGRHHDAVQTAQLITKLQPRFPGVWSFLSWDLAWNISVQTHTPQERWRWVNEGLTLLRDRGIQYNPRDLQLYKDLSWIYFAKIGDITDDMHMAYKAYLAEQYHRVLGAPPTWAYDDEAATQPAARRPATKDDFVLWLQPIVEAPTSLGALRQSDPDAAGLLDRLSEMGIQPDIGLLDAYARWSGDPQIRLVGELQARPANDREETIRQLMTDPALTDARAAAVAFARRRVLTETYRLDPAWMQRITSEYGPLDWRLPWAHALYWSSYGMHYCQGVDPLDVTSLNNDRNVLNSLKMLTSAGRLSMSYNRERPEMPILVLRPDWRFVQATSDAHERMQAAVPVGPDGTTETQFFRDSHVNYLLDVIQTTWLGAYQAEARKWYDYIRARYPDITGDPRWQQDVGAFVLNSLPEAGLQSQRVARELVGGSLQSAYLALAVGDVEEYELYRERAGFFYQRHQEGVTDRTALPPFAALQAVVAFDAIVVPQQAGTPPMTLVQASQFYGRLPAEVRAWMYDSLQQELSDAARTEGIDLDRAFPPPPGLEAVRQQRAAMNRAIAPAPQ